jgi:hypothetical protein
MNFHKFLTLAFLLCGVLHGSPSFAQYNNVDPALVSDFSDTSLHMADTLAKAINTNQKCQMSTSRGEVLEILVRAFRLDGTYTQGNLSDQQKAFLAQIQKQPSITEAMKGYVGYGVFINQLQLNNFSNPFPVDKLSTLLLGSTFDYGGESGYSKFDELTFKENGVLTAEYEDPSSNKYLTVDGTWSASMVQVEKFGPKSVVIDLKAANLSEQMILDYDVFPYYDSVRLRKVGSDATDENGFQNEVRFCAQ